MVSETLIMHAGTQASGLLGSQRSRPGSVLCQALNIPANQLHAYLKVCLSMNLVRSTFCFGSFTNSVEVAQSHSSTSESPRSSSWVGDRKADQPPVSHAAGRPLGHLQPFRGPGGAAMMRMHAPRDVPRPRVPHTLRLSGLFLTITRIFGGSGAKKMG